MLGISRQTAASPVNSFVVRRVRPAVAEILMRQIREIPSAIGLKENIGRIHVNKNPKFSWSGNLSYIGRFGLTEPNFPTTPSCFQRDRAVPGWVTPAVLPFNSPLPSSCWPRQPPNPVFAAGTTEPSPCTKQRSTPAHAPRPAGPENRLWLAEHHRQNRLPPVCQSFVKNLFFYLFFHRRCMAPSRRQLVGDLGAKPAIAEHRPAVRNRPSKPCVFRGIPTKGAWHVVG